ncbi:hypothetical protein [Acidisoma sp. C75]
MKRLGISLALASSLTLAACADVHVRDPSTAVIQPAALHTNGDVDVQALNIAGYDFGHWRQMQGDPAMAAEAVATLDYMGGKLNTAPRWITTMPSIFRLNMLRAREQVRAYLGIGSAVPSQQVVDAMLALAAAYRAGDQAQVTQILSEPFFTLGPQQTAARLADLPSMPSVTNATTHAAAYALGPNLPPG